MKISEHENHRNSKNGGLYEAILREAFPDVSMVACAHHIFFKRSDGAVEELPSADALIFDHGIAQKIWGSSFPEVLERLASQPVPERDLLLRELFEGRQTR